MTASTMDGTEHSTGRPRTIRVTVNRQPVDLPGREVSGLEVKQAAIAQGVQAALPSGSTIKLATFDLNSWAISAVKAGTLDFIVDQQQYLQGYFAVSVLVLYNLYGLTPNIDTGGYLITKDNLGLIEQLSGKYR